ncbi:hypothetical protein [Halobaculum magnesiiphilum]|uniref:Uncharacterized protein n=1 Tax=Halobaculum magnesiiphilum TaxID=1017351 RepID=A0A8T8WI95_9EURY|nr:hypothetical protein [Halobaculum magnesiiphilum]QZP39516.1 hypothetical protein K6T50_18240 [Halobaculum magnesiiphilum]
MSTCRVEQRRQADRLADTLALNQSVVAVDVFAPGVGAREVWVVEATLDCASIPTEVLRTLAAGDAIVVDTSPQGPANMIVTATI